MIQFSERMKTLMQNPATTVFYLVRIHDMYFTDYPSELHSPDGKIYVSSDLLKGISQPSLTGTTGRDLYSFVLTDVNGTLFGGIESNLVGSPVHIKIGFVDPETGYPELNDVFSVYDGFFESGSYTIDTSEIGEITLTVTCSNPLGDLDSASPIVVSADAMMSIDPDDTSYEELYVGSIELVLGWGKL
jgi:hypothetical protein